MLQDTTTDQVTMQDNLPLLECRDDLEDFETLMNLVDDYDNTTLVPIDGPPQKDIVKEMNKDCGINNDLELAMENAKFLDRHLLVDSTNIPTESGKTKKNRTETAKNKKITIRTNTPGSPKGQLTVKTHGIRRLGPEERQDKRFRCTECQFTGYSRATISDHFKTSHGPVYCTTCGKKCANPHALKRHEYEHADEKQFQCNTCGQEFFFESELRNHRIKHRTRPSFNCMHPGCGKSFKRNSELNAHVEVHSGHLWRCDSCDYSNTNKRLLKGHERIHSDKLKFKCKYEGCEEKFKHTMAHLRHYNKDH